MLYISHSDYNFFRIKNVPNHLESFNTCKKLHLETIGMANKWKYWSDSIFSYTMQQCVLTRMKSCCCNTIAQQKQQYLSILHISGHDNDKER